jgi:hypothetical protein
MEPQYSILVFSKFSPNCQRLIDKISSSGLNMGLQSLCIDNDKYANVYEKIGNLTLQ